MRVEYKGSKVSLSFVASKAKLSDTPLHSISIPHLELMGPYISALIFLSVPSATFFLDLRLCENKMIHVMINRGKRVYVYGAVFYLRVEYKGGKVSLSFVTSNARVIPLCLISICHLELMEAVIGKN